MEMVLLKDLHDYNALPTTKWNIKQPSHDDIREEALENGTFYLKIDGSNGAIFKGKDEKTGEILKLKFITIHDPVRQIDGDIYFACTDFHLADNPKKIYDIDFWLKNNN